MNTVFSAANTDVTASWYLTGLLWDYGYGLYTAGDHVMAVVPSKRGQRICPVGQSSVTNSNGQKVCSGPDKSSPYLNMCPDDISSPVTSEGYTLISWTPPTFSGATSVISNFVPDTTFPLGIDPVMYVAKNAALNYNECTFRALASLGTCSGLQAPNGASAPVCSQGVGDGELYTRCTVSCPTGMAFLRPLPNILDCWEAGVWNTYNPYVDLQLPPCGNLGTVRKRIVFGFIYNLKSAFSPSAGATIQTALQTALSNWNQILTSAGAGVCTDSTCANTNIIVFNSNGQAGVTITLDQSPLKVGSGVSAKTAVVQATLVDQRFVVTTVPGADSIDPTTFTMTDTTQCDSNTQPTGDQCVQCPPGTYFNSTAQLCLNCAVGSYQDQPMQAQCIPCGTGLTTQKDGSDSLSDCFTSCNPGSYYDFTAQSCLPCPQAQYQTCSGRSFCQRCPSGKTTSSTGASSPASCFNDCPSGYQLMSNGSCAICAVGTYRLQGFQSNCTQCPDGYTTLQSGSIRATDCNTVVCPPGQFRAGVNPGTCNPCPIGFYRNASQANCTSCGDSSKWRTSDVGATDYSFCKFYCPAGQYISAINQCSVCPQSTYKDLSVDDNYYATSCTQCSPPLSVTASTGATSSAACLYPACTAGQVVDSVDNTQCANCPFNTYQPNPVPTTDTCISCPPNTGTPFVGTANATQCSILCPSGQEVNTTTLRCQPCARAFWKDNTISQAVSFSPCQPCPSGTITPSTGATSDSQCTQADCQPGSSINPTDNTQCDQCVVGTYQTMKWQTSCTPCPSGSSTFNAGSVFLSDCNKIIDTRVFLIKFTVLLPFINDYFLPSSASFIQFKTQVEYMMTNLLKLKIRSFRGTARALAFTPGSIVVTAQAQFNNSDLTVSSSLSSTLQVAFSSGLFSDPTGQYAALPVSTSAYSLVYIGPFDAPTVCSGGQGINYGTGLCEPCAVGSYQLPWMTQVCASCPAGYSTLQAGTVGDQTSCLLVCGAGKESRDGTTCQACLPNFFKTASGSASCTACDPGLITVASGATSVSQCQAACPSGQYSTGTPPVCQPCPQGSYQNVTNQLSCIPCPQFYNTAGQGASDISACLDVCSLDATYCQNSGKCTFDVNTKQASCACTVIFAGDRCGSFSWVLWVIIAAGAVVVALVVIIIVVCVYRHRKNKGVKDQKKLQQQLQNLQLQNAIKSQQDILNPQQKSVLKSRPPLMMYDESNLAGVVPQQHVSFYNPTYRNDQGAAMNTLYGMSPGYAPSLSHSSGFLFHEDADDTRLHPTQRTPTSGAFYQAS